MLGTEYINAQDFVKGIPGQIDRVHLSPEQHKVLGEAAAAKVKEIFAH
jgi:lysophospholipase L1-like esterase